MKLLNIFKKKEAPKDDNTHDEAKEKRTTYFYIIVFLIIFSLALTSRFFGDDNISNNDANSSSMEEVKEDSNLLEELKYNNYDLRFIEIIDSSFTEYLIRKESLNKELISKTHDDINDIYYIANNKTYKISLNKKYETNENIFNEVSKTFLDINNLNKLINEKTYELDLKEESYDIKRYKIEISKVIKIFNDYNNKNIKKIISGEVTLDVNYKSNEIKGLKLDLLTLHQNLELDNQRALYYYEFGNINKVKIEEFESLITE